MKIRENEFKQLEEDFKKPKSSLNFIFGRKKVGKSAFLYNYTKDKTTLSLNAFEALPNILSKRLLVSVNNFFKTKYTIENIQSLEDLFSLIAKQEINQKIVIVLENLHYMQNVNKNFLKNFYTIWSRQLKYKNVQFIITSSIYYHNKEHMQVFNKATNVIKLKSHSFNMIKLSLKDLPKKDFLYVYSTFGTNPSYLKHYDVKKDFFTNLKDTIFNPNHFLFKEGLNLLKSNLSDVVTYTSILYAIANGNNKIGDIASFLNLKSSYLTRYIQNLVDLMLISKEVPINEDEKKSKFGRYEFEDNFLKFWFLYIFPNSNPSNSEYVLILKHIQNDLTKNLLHTTYKKYAYEMISNEPEKYFGYIPNKIGKWWNNKSKDIDIVAFDNKNITFVDCKLKGQEEIEESYKQLQDKAEEFISPLNKKYAIFTL